MVLGAGRCKLVKQLNNGKTFHKISVALIFKKFLAWWALISYSTYRCTIKDYLLISQ